MMSEVSVPDKRITLLNSSSIDVSGECIVYWMQKSQRVSNNAALAYAVELANNLHKPLCVYFGLSQSYAMGSARVFNFMLEGLIETAIEVKDLGIGFCMRLEDPSIGLPIFAKEVKACAVITDEDYLRTGRIWRSKAAELLNVQMLQIDSDTIVPVRNQPKEEWAAYTIRPKIRKALPGYLHLLPEISVSRKWTTAIDDCQSPIEVKANLDQMTFDQQVAPVNDQNGGVSAARNRLEYFIGNLLPDYADKSGEIEHVYTSELSAYLHFGQISPNEIAVKVSEADAPGESIDAFLEQLIVRRELAINFCFYNNAYDTLSPAPDWAKQTLDAHRSDEREVLYSLSELEAAKTYNALWNAAQQELITRGRINTYLRMLWAKKIMQWSPTPEIALEYCIYLNDKYALDGRDPNGYAGIAWSIYGKHDRPFGERPIFGKIRYMSTKSTYRKKRCPEYISRIAG